MNRWLHQSDNLHKKLRYVFKSFRSELSLPKTSREETLTDDWSSAFKEYLDILNAMTQLGALSFVEAEKELEFALGLSHRIVNEEGFSSMLTLIKVVQTLHRP